MRPILHMLPCFLLVGFSQPILALPHNIFGPEDPRILQASIYYPYSAIGIFRNAEGDHCTATLVSRSHILTAAHCVLEGTEIGDRQKMTFFPNVVRGKADTLSGIEEIILGTTNTDEQIASDWAIMRLSVPLGERYGWLAVQPIRDYTGFIGEAEASFHLVAYSADIAFGKTATQVSSCHIQAFPTDELISSSQGYLRRVYRKYRGMILHDCSSTEGASGAPIYRIEAGQVFIVGMVVKDEHFVDDPSPLHLAEYDPHRPNVAVPATAFVGVLSGEIGADLQGFIPSRVDSTAFPLTSWGQIKIKTGTSLQTILAD